VRGRSGERRKGDCFLTDVDDRALINPVRQRYFGTHRPASTLVEVSALVLPELQVEIEAQAVLG
jgi:2-iminobutanoate/2-iminopropanoate deaminase